MTTKVPSLWDKTFPTIPQYIISPETLLFTDIQSLIDFVRVNSRIIEDNWTDAIRQKGIQGRLQMAEDDNNDGVFRSGNLLRAIQSAQNNFLNT